MTGSMMIVRHRSRSPRNCHSAARPTESERRARHSRQFRPPRQYRKTRIEPNDFRNHPAMPLVLLRLLTGEDGNHVLIHLPHGPGDGIPPDVVERIA
jgi:hypothetical protein